MRVQQGIWRPLASDLHVMTALAICFVDRHLPSPVKAGVIQVVHSLFSFLNSPRLRTDRTVSASDRQAAAGAAARPQWSCKLCHEPACTRAPSI